MPLTARGTVVFWANARRRPVLPGPARPAALPCATPPRLARGMSGFGIRHITRGWGRLSWGQEAISSGPGFLTGAGFPRRANDHNESNHACGRRAIAFQDAHQSKDKWATSAVHSAVCLSSNEATKSKANAHQCLWFFVDFNLHVKTCPADGIAETNMGR